MTKQGFTVARVESLACEPGNQVVGGSLVPANKVPAVTEVCRRHPLHWNSGRILTLITQWARWPQPGQAKPLGHRAAITASAQAVSDRV